MAYLFRLLFCCFLSASMLCAAAQTDDQYDPLETFRSFSYNSTTPYRTMSGKPGNQYWQNRADYRIVVSFDTLTRRISGTVNIRYTNNSPHPLSDLWIRLTQNRFRKDSKVAATTPVNGSRFGVKEYTNGMELQSVEIGQKNKKFAHASWLVVDDNLRLQLPFPLSTRNTVELKINYAFTLPHKGSDFMGIQLTGNGNIYQVSGWYPRVTIFDDLQGWNVANNGYYVEPGLLDYTIKAPANLIIQGTGELVNPSEALTKQELEKYNRAKQSSSTITIRSASEITHDRTEGKQWRSWHFRAENAGDGMWAASAAFIWDAANLKLPDHKQILAMCLYPVECNMPVWQQATQSVKQILEYNSRKWIPYPYPTAVTVAGGVTGLAASAVSFIDYQSDQNEHNGVWAKLNHEWGHTWFNLMVAANGRQSWMCEGLNSLINDISGNCLQNYTAFPMQLASNLTGSNRVPALTTPAELVMPDHMALHAYMKPALALYLLRKSVLGEERFDAAFREFIRDWAFKHPGPDDFFRSMENSSGEKLDWFWNSWFRNNWQLDQAVKKIAYKDSSPEKGVYITVQNKGKMVMPLEVEIKEFNGNARQIQLPVDIWTKNTTWTFYYASTSPVVQVQIDPDNILPDADKRNNSWKGSGERKPLPAGASIQSVIDRYLQVTAGAAPWKSFHKYELVYSTKDSIAPLQLRKASLGLNRYEASFGFPSIDFFNQWIQINDTSFSYKQHMVQQPTTPEERELLQLMAMPFPELHFGKKGYPAVLEDSLVNDCGMDVFVITVKLPSGREWKYYYDVASGLKIRDGYTGTPDMKGLYHEIEYLRYESKEGCMIPTLIHTQRGNESAVCTLQSLIRTLQ